jgi:demethylmenaquinone methyltransferase/2-methoxy-6-polyprenyl-1,4-benzoquinol methylase
MNAYDKKSKYQLLDEVGFREHFQADSWSDFNLQFFNGLAPKYDRLNEVLSLGQHQRIKRSAIRRLNIHAGAKILDVCTGSGDTAMMMAKAHPEAHVIGVDVSEKMLEIARQKTQGLANVEFRLADAMHLPFEQGCFDVALISFGLRNLEDLKFGLLEMKRVTREGGVVSNLDLGQPPKGFLEWVHQVYFRTFVPWLGKTFFHRGEFNSFAYLPTSGKYFPSQQELAEIFKELGFCRVARHDFMLGSISQQLGFVP